MKKSIKDIIIILGSFSFCCIIYIIDPVTSSLLFIYFFPIILYEVIVRICIIRGLTSLELKYNPVELESIPEIDKSILRDYTEDLELLGFNIILDSQNSVKFCSRIFVHPELYCFAVLIIKLYPHKKGIDCSILSCLEQNWSTSITNRLSDKLAATSYAFNRCPRSVFISIPEATPAQMLPHFLELRQQMSEDLRINIIPDLSLEGYQQRERQSLRFLSRNIWRKSILYCLLERYLYLRSPKLEWYGAYHKFVQQRKRNPL